MILVAVNFTRTCVHTDAYTHTNVSQPYIYSNSKLMGERNQISTYQCFLCTQCAVPSPCQFLASLLCRVANSRVSHNTSLWSTHSLHWHVVVTLYRHGNTVVLHRCRYCHRCLLADRPQLLHQSALPSDPAIISSGTLTDREYRRLRSVCLVLSRSLHTPALSHSSYAIILCGTALQGAYSLDHLAVPLYHWSFRHQTIVSWRHSISIFILCRPSQSRVHSRSHMPVIG